MAMSKEELKDAINQTIVANGQKGITAESLNDLLNEIADSIGENIGGGGVLFTIGNGKADENGLVNITEEELAQNAEMFKIFKERKMPVSVLMKELFSESMPDLYAEMVMNASAIYIPELIGIVIGTDGECCIIYMTQSGTEVSFMVKPSGVVIFPPEQTQ